MLLLFLFDLEGLTPLPTYPKEWDQNQVVHSQKLFLWVGLFLEFLKMVLRRGKEASRHRVTKEVKLFAFN